MEDGEYSKALIRSLNYHNTIPFPTTSHFSLETGNKGQLFPEAAGQTPPDILRNMWEGNHIWTLQWLPKWRLRLSANIPPGKGQDPGLGTNKGSMCPLGGQGMQPHGCYLHISPDPEGRGHLPIAWPHTFLQHLWEIITLPALKKHSQQILVS